MWDLNNQLIHTPILIHQDSHMNILKIDLFYPVIVEAALNIFLKTVCF